MRRKAFLLDVSYYEKKGQAYIQLLVKGKKKTKLLYPFDPYFLLDPAPASAEKVAAELKRVTIPHKKEEIKIKDAVVVQKIWKGERKALVKVICHKPTHVPILAKHLPFRCFEYRIPYIHRFFLDTGLTGSSTVIYEREGPIVKWIKPAEQSGVPNINALAFDIEVYNPLGAPRMEKDPVILISAANEVEQVFTWKAGRHPALKVLKNEKEMLEAFFALLKKEDPDILIGYNTGAFDIPYLSERANQHGLTHPLKGKKSRKGEFTAIKLNSYLHVDLYPLMRFFGTLGMFNVRTYTLKHIFHEISGDEAVKIERFSLWEHWDKGEVDKLAEYCLSDSKATMYLFRTFWSLLLELSQLTHLPIFEVLFTTSGRLVETFLMRKCVEQNRLIPPKPDPATVSQRRANPVEGAFVKMPEPGIYEELVVFDFRSLYPSIIITYNIDPETITQEGEDVYISPIGVKFKKEPRGLIPSTLESLISLRTELKKKLKTLEPHTKEYEQTRARVQALKILANSFYGYLAYANSRWYSRECAASVTAWGRYHIQKAAEYAESKGFKVLYIDTDSLFLLLNGKSKEEALQLLKEINSQLPGVMELELEAFYKRALFVSKKADEAGAKKKYALLREDGEIKIRGFELVRRDWSNIARETQKRVLETILKEGSKEKAVQIVKDVIRELRSGQVDLKDLVIYTQLKKKPESYDVKSPEVVAALKAKRRGIPVDKGAIIPYIITKHGSSISEKAEYADFAKDYDPEYYIDHQILPAVLKILKELGYTKEELKFEGKQADLTAFF